MLRYADIIDESVVDGLGIRVTAFFQGCPRHCEGCHNPNLLTMTGGKEISENEFVDLLLSKLSPLHKGVTFSGGDPLAQAEALLHVVSLLKQQKPQIDIWVYTGFVFEEVLSLPVMNLIDVLVDGPFIAAQKDLSLAFRGSANQRIIDVPKSLTAGRVIEAVIENSFRSRQVSFM